MKRHQWVLMLVLFSGISLSSPNHLVKFGWKLDQFLKHHNQKIVKDGTSLLSSIDDYIKFYRARHETLILQDSIVQQREHELLESKHKLMDSYRTLRDDYKESMKKLNDIEKELLQIPPN